MNLVSEHPISKIWQILARYESVELSAKLLLRKLGDSALADEVLTQRVGALAYCLRNAREYCSVQSTSLTTAITLNYYGCIWLTAAAAVATPTLNIGLVELDNSTRFGHGLGNLPPGAGSFPENEYVYISKKGLLVDYLKWTGMSDEDLATVCMPNRPKSVETADQNRLIGFLDSFARIPELRYAFSEITDNYSACYDVSIDQARQQEEKYSNGYSWISIIGPTDVDAAFYASLGVPLVDMELRSSVLGYKYWSGKLFHPKEIFWAKQLKAYSSPQDQDYYWVQPLLNKVSDPIASHLILLYHLSILARYRPAVWREILEGKYDAYRSLILEYNSIFARVVPHLTLNRIVGAGVRVSLPSTPE